MVKRNESVDLEIPTGITARELVLGLNEAFGLGIDTSYVKKCYMQSENPIALIKGNKLISDIGLRDGSSIYYTL